MTQRSSVAKKIIKNALSNIRTEMPKLKESEKRIQARLIKSPTDERTLELEATLKTRAAIAKDHIEKLELLLEGNDIRLINKMANRAIIRVDGEDYTFSIIPAKLLNIARGLTSP